MLYLGVDVAKAKLDCLLLDPTTHKRKSKSVANSAEGIGMLLKTLQAWGVETADIHVVMEPTSSYHELAALALHDAGCTVSLLNPAKLRRYAQSIGALSKTDAAVLARYGAAERPPAWQPPVPAARALRALLARRDAVAEDLQRERNRAEKTTVTDTPEAVSRSLQAALSFLEHQLQALQKEISQHIDQDPRPARPACLVADHSRCRRARRAAHDRAVERISFRQRCTAGRLPRPGAGGVAIRIVHQRQAALVQSRSRAPAPIALPAGRRRYPVQPAYPHPLPTAARQGQIEDVRPRRCHAQARSPVLRRRSLWQTV